MRLEIKILGPMEATISGIPCIPSASKPRQLFALLAVNAGRVVSMSEMMEELWGSAPPRSVITTLHTYVRLLRKKLDAALEHDRSRSSKDFLVTEPGGYLLAVAPEDIDAGRYDRLSSAGRDAATNGDYPTATELLGTALRLWRGPTLTDVEIGPQLGIELAWLEESRLGALELRIDVDLRLGRHHQLLGELAGLCARYPMLESFHAQYMLALHRSGRQWRALETYHRVRTALVDQLGIDPSPRLQRLHHAILAGVPSVDDSSFVTNSWLPGDQKLVAMNPS
jgi:SARP family transcriptional regulator, regulator of embCAB operon